jgi:serine/threonine-protein kinase RsbW
MGKQVMQLTIESTPAAVRHGLASLMACSVMQAMDTCGRGTAEIVLAEVLNNIVEHAYAGQQGEISVSICSSGNGVGVCVIDRGNAFPQVELPQGKLAPANELPEGGFGWFLIRSLVSELTYRRDHSTNHLSFTLPCGQRSSDT